MKSLITILAAAAVLFSAQAAPAQETPVTVGTVAGSDVEMLEKAVEVALRDGLAVEIREFSDYGQLNPALAAGDIDLNSFQHIPFLESYLKDHPDGLVSIGTTYVSPMGFFSKKIKSLDELKKGDTVVIPNDPSNGGRALLLLQAAGKISLKPEAGITPTPFDVTRNALELKIVEVDAAQTFASLEDAATAAINNNYAQDAGLNPLKDAIYLEDQDSPYVNVIVARDADKDNPRFLQFVKAYQSAEVAEFILQKYEGATIPAFKYQTQDQTSAPAPAEAGQPARP
ncbi:MAG: MetQ/NlpA family ABC transporter substrate-binding protein [Deltaproteobacteria bacterium]|jgi:D-methionine transport system substrate-binding protein|nr:MetQ/NlpA family ABC transporter substrate-binding protein [Deltaproteobacteria bacterium]